MLFSFLWLLVYHIRKKLIPKQKQDQKTYIVEAAATNPKVWFLGELETGLALVCCAAPLSLPLSPTDFDPPPSTFCHLHVDAAAPVMLCVCCRERGGGQPARQASRQCILQLRVPCFLHRPLCATAQIHVTFTLKKNLIRSLEQPLLRLECHPPGTHGSATRTTCHSHLCMYV